MRLHNAGQEGSASKEHEGLELKAKRVKHGERILPDRQAVKEFDALLQEKQQYGAHEHQQDQVSQLTETKDDLGADPRATRKKNLLGLDGLPTEPPAALLAMLMPPGQVQIQQQLSQQASVGAQRASDVVELLRKHVRQLAMSPSLATGQTGQAWLRLSEDLLPGTELLIERGRDGWQIKARSDSNDSIQLMEQCAEQLKERFDEAGLGRIEFAMELVS